MKKLYLFILIVVNISMAMGQVAINTDNSDPDGSAILDILSPNKGILIPRVTLNDVLTADPVNNPAVGLLIFNIDGMEPMGFYYWNGSKWLQLLDSSRECDMFGNPAIEANCNDASASVAVCEGTSLNLSSNNNGSWEASTPTYSWTGPNSFTSSSAIPGEVTASFSAATHAGDYIITITNGVASGCSYSSVITVTAGPDEPADPGEITGNNNICEGTGNVPYSVSAVENATSYNWTVPADATITSGQGTTSINVNFQSTGGNVSVQAQNVCFNSNFTDFEVNILLSPSITSHPDLLVLAGTNGGNFSVEASDATSYQWQENNGNGFTNISDGSVYSGTTTGTLFISDGTGRDEYEYRCVVTNSCGNTISNPATLVHISVVHNPATNKYWLDRNLGALQVATATDDSDSYGDLYQWGRAGDGHESRTSNTTTTLATTYVPNDNNDWDGKYIVNTNWPNNWLDAQNDNLWQGVNGINNPCPAGYRLPTNAEFENEINTWSEQNRMGAFSSILALPCGGVRSVETGVITGSSSGCISTSSVSGFGSGHCGWYESSANCMYWRRGDAQSIRCIED